jgi:hypothetical protein
MVGGAERVSRMTRTGKKIEHGRREREIFGAEPLEPVNVRKPRSI